MIYLGVGTKEKKEIIKNFVDRNNIKSVISINGLGQSLTEDDYLFKEIIEYKPFYHLLQTIDNQSLLVINECLRTQNRYDLAYNCIRNFLTQTPHKLIFQRLPFIDQPQDFMILFDFETRSQWKREPFDFDLLKQAEIVSFPQKIKFEKIPVDVSSGLFARYNQKKKQLFDNLGAKDPHIIPRNLQLLSTAEKKKGIRASVDYVARNKRFKLDNVTTYREVNGNSSYTVLDLPHRFINFSDFLYKSGQTCIDVLTADLKVEKWYFSRYHEWSERLNGFYSEI